jgi:hypothetical protein
MTLHGWTLFFAAALVPGAVAPGAGSPAVGEGLPERAGASAAPLFCAAPPGAPEYYAIDLVSTRQVVGTGGASGAAHMTFDTTPFGVSLAPDGSYRTTLHVQVDRLPARRQGHFVAWATTPQLDQVVRIGVLDDEGLAKGTVEWNKFLVVVTLEPEGAAGADAGSGAAVQTGAAPGTRAGGAPSGDVSSDLWTGPVVLRGMSRSGRMHTMAGHGPFEQQECAAFGY